MDGVHHRDRHRPSGRSRPVLGAALFIVFWVLLGLSGASARADALVSNIDLAESADLPLSDLVRLQEFTAGDEGATLGRVEIRFSSGSARLDAPSAALLRREGSGHVAVAELAGPGKLEAGVNAFFAPANTKLEADTVYAVRLEGGGSGAALRGTADDGESGKDGWSVADGSLRGKAGASTYESVAAALMIRADEADPGRRYDPFEPPLPPILSASERISADGAWTVSWSGADAGDFYTYVELEETPPGGSASTTTHYAAPGGAAISGRTAAGDYGYRVRGCRNLCSVWTPALTVTYAANSRPVVGAISDLAVSRGSTATRTARVTDGDSGDSHTVSATSDDEDVATVSVSGRKLTVRGAARGTATISVTATDDSGAPNDTSVPVKFDATVPNSRPVLASISDLTISRGSTGTRTVTVTDADSGDAHTVSASSDDEDVATVSVSGKKLAVRGVGCGEATISVTAADGSGESNARSAAEKFKATVPSSPPAVGAISDLTVSRGSTTTVTVTVTDADAGDSHAISASSDDMSVATASVSGKKLTVRGVSRGTATVEVTATDECGDSGSTEFDATVPNSRPVAGSISDLTVLRGSTETRTVTVADGDSGDAHAVSASSDDPGVATVSVSGERVRVRGVARGEATISVTATDDSGESNATSEAVEFDATVPNSRPVAGSISDLTVSRGSTVTRTARVTDGDVGDAHTVTASSDDTSVATVSVSGRTLNVSGVSRGTATIEVSATDDSGEANATSAAAEFDVEVTASTPSNSRPVVSPIADRRVGVGADRAAQVAVTVTDADSGDTHAIAAASADETIATVAANNKTLTITGMAAGGARISVTATDDSGESNATSAAETFMVSVRGFAGQLRADPNPSEDGAYRLSWDARDGYPFHVLLEGGAGSSSKRVAYMGEGLAHAEVGKAPGSHRYELRHCDVEMDSMPFSLTLTTCAGTDIPEATVTVNAPVGTSNIVARTEAGATPYRAGVTQGGDAYVNIPIMPAPGVNGLAPALSIDYGGGRDRELAEQSLPWDALGYGWHLSGFSTIRRCFVNRTGPANDLLATDSLCLNGEPLVLVEGTALQPGAEYRLLRERFVKVTVKGTAPRVWFEAKGPDGSVSEYGNTEDSELHYATAHTNGAATMTKAYQWSISKRTDAFGNIMSYVYHEDESAGVRHPLRAEYGNGGDAAVEFGYVHRKDLSPVMLGPASTRAQAQNLLLREVRVLRDRTAGADGARSGKLVRAYRLQTETAGAQRRLDKVQLCGYDKIGAGEKCLAPIDIDWTTPDADLSAVVSRVTDSLGRKTEFEHGVLKESGSHAFLFSERPFGNPPASIPGTSVLAGDDPNDADEVLKAVVTKMKAGERPGRRRDLDIGMACHELRVPGERPEEHAALGLPGVRRHAVDRRRVGRRYVPPLPHGTSRTTARSGRSTSTTASTAHRAPRLWAGE